MVLALGSSDASGEPAWRTHTLGCGAGRELVFRSLIVSVSPATLLHGYSLGRRVNDHRIWGFLNRFVTG